MELDSLQHRATEIAGRLVGRPEDTEVRVQQEIQHYREAMLRSLEDFIIQHSQQYVIELDANLPPQPLFRVSAWRQRLLYGSSNENILDCSLLERYSFHQ